MRFDVYIQNATNAHLFKSYEYDFFGIGKTITIEGDESTHVTLIDEDLESLPIRVFLPKIKKVIYNPPATVIIWNDDTKTVVKCQEEDIYDKQTGFLLCIMKKIFGNKFNDILRRWVFNTEKNEDVRDNTLDDCTIFDEIDHFKKAAENFLQQQLLDAFVKGINFDEENNREA